MMRSFTTSLEVTKDRKLAEENADIKVIGIGAVQKSALYAQMGDYTKAQLHTRSNQRYMQRNIKTEKEEALYARWRSKNEKMDKEIRTITFNEAPEMKSASSRRTARQQNDKAAQILFKNKKANTKSLYEDEASDSDSE